jgi:putative aldouronate transport system substrate-binding protein
MHGGREPPKGEQMVLRKKTILLTMLCASLLLAFLPVMATAEEQWVPKDSSGKVMKVTPESFYKYDDMSKHFDISYTLSGWVNDQPQPPDDPMIPYLEKKFNATITLTALGDTLATKVMAQIASGTGPDVVGTDPRMPIIKILEQKMLSGDHKKYLQYIPAVTQQYDVDGNDLLQATRDGALFAIPKHEPQPEYFYIQIRQDWLDTLGLAQPRTDTELMKAAEAFTFRDPDGNGKADTWGFTMAGKGPNEGADLEILSNPWGGLDVFQAMYGNPGWYVENNKLTNPTLSGSRLKFLKFFREAVVKGVMDPDYLMNNVTSDWTSRKLHAGRAGIFSYHTDITGEAEGALGQEGKLTGTWKMLESPLKGDDGKSGGKRRPNTDKVSMWIAFTKQGAKDQAKVKRFLHILDWWQYPNDGVGITWFAWQIDPAMNRVRTKDYQYFGGLDSNCQRNSRAGWAACYNWGKTGAWYSNMLWGGSKEPSATPLFALKQMNVVGAMDRYPGNLYYVCDIPSKLDAKVQEFQVTNEIAFISGTRSLDTWDAYVKEWRANGGQELTDLMATQLKKLGRIR